MKAVSDIGFIGSWFCICVTRRLRKSLWFKVWVGSARADDWLLDDAVAGMMEVIDGMAYPLGPHFPATAAAAGALRCGRRAGMSGLVGGLGGAARRTLTLSAQFLLHRLHEGGLVSVLIA